jgi:hypothetical protein
MMASTMPLAGMPGVPMEINVVRKIMMKHYLFNSKSIYR